MLIERTFEIGGVLLGAGGVVLIVASVWGGYSPDALAYIESGGLLAGFGVFFAYVGWQARQERLRLLAMGESGHVPGSPGWPPKR
jgi:uncharacterized membrane protein